MARVCQGEGAQRGVEVGLAHGTLHGAEGDARCEPRGGRGRPERMDADVACEDASALGRWTESALDTAAAHGSHRGSQVCVSASARGKEPGGVARGVPGAAPALSGVMRQGDRAVRGARAAVDVEHGARASDSAHVKGQRVVPAQPTAGDGGEGDALVQGGGGMAETAHLFQAEESREAVCRLGAHEVEGLPVAPQDVVGEAAEATGAEAHGRWSEAIDVCAVQAGGLELLCGDHVRRCARALGQQTDLTDRGFLSPLALATALQRGNHVLTQGGHEISPFVR